MKNLRVYRYKDYCLKAELFHIFQNFYGLR